MRPGSTSPNSRPDEVLHNQTFNKGRGGKSKSTTYVVQGFVKPRLRKIIGYFAVVAFGAVLAALLMETLLRVFTPDVIDVGARVKANLYSPDPVLGWVMKSNFEGIEEKKEFRVTTRINERGFRDDSYAEGSPESSFRILALGDSFTYGYGVEHDETYLELLEVALNAPPTASRDYRVYNVAVPGYSLREYSTFLKTSWVEFDPDLIIIGIGSNDHTDSVLPHPKYDVADGYLVSYKGNGDQDSNNTDPVLRVKIFLYKHFYVYRLLPETKRRVTDNREARRFEGQIESKVEEAWRQASGYLDQILEVAQQNSIPLVLIYIPHRSQVHPGLRVDFHIDTRLFDDFDQRIEEYSADRSVLYVNTLPEFVEQANRGETLYFVQTDAHWNVNGHRAAANMIYDALQQLLTAK